jgi:hypothetical protein
MWLQLDHHGLPRRGRTTLRAGPAYCILIYVVVLVHDDEVGNMCLRAPTILNTMRLNNTASMMPLR